MPRLIRCKEHGPGPAAAMCRHLLEDPSPEWVEVPADPELGANLRDWRCPRCAERYAEDLFAAGDLSLVCMQHAHALREAAPARAEARDHSRGPLESCALCRHLIGGGSPYWIEGAPQPVPDSDRVVRIWVCPECVESGLSTLIAGGSLALVAVHEAEVLRRRDELAGATILPWTGDDVCGSCAAPSSRETSASRLGVVARLEKRRKGRRRK